MAGESKFKIDLQGLIRTTLTIGTIIGGYYLDRSTINDNIAENRREISVLNAELRSHIGTARNYTIGELSEKFVTRREWESNHKSLRDDVKYLRQKTDAIYDKVNNIR